MTTFLFVVFILFARERQVSREDDYHTYDKLSSMYENI